MRRRLLPIIWICLGAWAFASAAAAQAPGDYGGDGLAGGPESYREAAYPALERRSGKRPGSLDRERTGSSYEADARRHVSTLEPGHVERGTASWYGAELQGWQTDSGERFDPTAMTAAHPTLPMHSLVEVTNLDNGREAILRVNDRGPFEPSRLIEVSRAAAEVLGFVRAGHARVQVRYLGPSPDYPRQNGSRRRGGGGYGEYVVQVGAYAQLNNAQRARATVAADGWPVVVDPLARRHRGLFRIRVGPWASYEEAYEAQSTLRRHGYADAFVTTR